MPHTLLLIQATKPLSSRTYRDFQTISQASDYLIAEFERKLKEMNPNLSNLRYDPQDLFQWIDSHSDMGALVFEQGVRAYAPHDKKWIKDQLLRRLQEKAGGGRR